MIHRLFQNFKELKNINVSVITLGEMFFGANNSNNSLKNTEIHNDFFDICNIFEITRKTSNIMLILGLN